ncbi:hypothetical protein SEVIR_9G169300v4 [Setaria viridis]|uniref:Uncharacterized protein n=1 Tax=Setaria viridis TaxID=4556 RepID=A0A4U6SUR1_SETVI|nr:hypothetical protein SEVIR_9G169300v2 [Setaria viridis]TKV92557.1 hypothetical protein SEVIR_9G169300v2 [Setaria viridis]TKV92558.1 hypothetical protein SEVIR_9G169300v2 [Setaria viridis]TKV92559.1 hypothetical protein SEVIR_9G169300v2 [Setaria viridis]
MPRPRFAHADDWRQSAGRRGSRRPRATARRPPATVRPSSLTVRGSRAGDFLGLISSPSQPVSASPSCFFFLRTGQAKTEPSRTAVTRRPNTLHPPQQFQIATTHTSSTFPATTQSHPKRRPCANSPESGGFPAAIVVSHQAPPPTKILQAPPTIFKSTKKRASPAILPLLICCTSTSFPPNPKHQN